MSPADSMRAERDELLVALKEVKAENERLRGSSRDHDPSIGSALESDAEHLRLAMNGVRAALPILYNLLDNEYNVDSWGILGRISALEAARDYRHSRAKPNEGESSRDEVKPSPAKAENR